MKFSPKRIVVKLLKIVGFSIVGLLLVMFALPFIIPGTVSDKIKSLANNALEGEMDFSRARLSFFNHFPSLTLSLYDFSLKGSAPFQKDTLIAADELAWGIHLPSLLTSKIKINRFFITKGKIRVLVNEKGEANYNVYKSVESSAQQAADSSNASLKIEKIVISESELTYDDASIPLTIRARGLNYSGKGDLSKAIFDLYSTISIRAFDLIYDKTPYIVSRKINADLLTKINTNSLALRFERNNLKIHNLPVSLKGVFEFLNKGYNMDFKLKTNKATLDELLSVLPPEYDQWLADTKASGNIDVHVSLAGPYIYSENKMPHLEVLFKVRNGSIAHVKAPHPLEKLQLNLETLIPSLNPDSIQVKLDSMYFTMGKSFFDGSFRVKGISQPNVFANVNSELDLEALDRALGLQGVDLKGLFKINLKADGKYATGQDPVKLRKSVITTSIPSYQLKTSLQNGYFKKSDLPESISDISFTFNSSCADGNPDHINFSLNDLQAKSAGNFIRGYCRLNSKDENPIDAHIESDVHLSEFRKFYPMDSIELKGDLSIRLDTKGKYDQSNNQFPTTEGKVVLKNGSIQTKYYPNPIEDIEIMAKATNRKGTLSGLEVLIDSIRFQFEGQPFIVKADLANFKNLRYGVYSKGTIDVGKVYKVFSQEGYDVKGFIKTNLSLNGTQEDALKGRYNRLSNKGTLEVQDIELRSDYFPMPFYITDGIFRFQQDKIWFEKFNARYGKTYFTLNGALSNVIDYALNENAPLQGSFNLYSKHLYVDEFAAFAEEFAEDAAESDPVISTEEEGVIMVPANLNFVFTANLEKTEFQGLTISDFKGEVNIDSGKIKLKETGFTIIDAPVKMNASYSHTSPTSAVFDFQLKADSFEVSKAYKEVQLFRELAPSAKSVKGMIGIDYALGGKLDGNMYPVFPSLSGGGVVYVSKVKLKGFKLMNAVSKSTNKEEMTDPDLSKVKIKSSIKNNIVTIERTKMRIAGFRPRFEGQYSFDGKLNLKGRIGLPPFGIVGIPFTVKGTQDNPIVKLKKDKDGKPLEETNESEKEEGENE